MKPARFALLIVAVILLCGLLFVGGRAWLAAALFTDPPPSAFNPPIYPNAQQVATAEDVGVSSQESVVNTVSFETADSPDAVLQYYSEELAKDGWFKPLRIPAGTGREPLYPENEFEWHQAGINGPTPLAYSLTIVT